MRLVEYLEKGASLGPERPCLSSGDDVRSYSQVSALSKGIAAALVASGVAPGDKVAILSSNDPTAFTCVFAISRAAAVWCPINPRSAAGENAEILDLFDCSVLIYQSKYAALVEEIADRLPKVTTYVCIDADTERAPSLARWVDDAGGVTAAAETWTDVAIRDDLAMVVGTGGTTGRPKGVQLSGHNLEAMTSIMLMSYPFGERPRYLALAPLTHAAGVLCFPILASGGEIVIMTDTDIGAFLDLIETRQITHTMLPPTLLYMLLAHEKAATTDYSSLRCFWYGSAPIAAARLEEALRVIGPVMAQYFGQTEAPMVITTMAPSDHFGDDGSVRRSRLSSAGTPAPLVTVTILDDDGNQVPAGTRGEIAVRGSLVTPGYYKNPAATAEVSVGGWHHTGDIGYLDEENFLFIVDRAKDMIVTGGFNVYSAEVEQVLLEHPDIQDCAVFGLPDEKWGERVTAVIEPIPGRSIDLDALRVTLRERLGGVKTPKQLEIMASLPRSTVGKVLKREVRAHYIE